VWSAEAMRGGGPHVTNAWARSPGVCLRVDTTTRLEQERLAHKDCEVPARAGLLHGGRPPGGRAADNYVLPGAVHREGEQPGITFSRELDGRSISAWHSDRNGLQLRRDLQGLRDEILGQPGLGHGGDAFRLQSVWKGVVVGVRLLAALWDKLFRRHANAEEHSRRTRPHAAPTAGWQISSTTPRGRR
jgi:hypothetical protein